MERLVRTLGRRTHRTDEIACVFWGSLKQVGYFWGDVVSDDGWYAVFGGGGRKRGQP